MEKLFRRLRLSVDEYNTMTSERPYQGPTSHESAVAELKRYAGSQFDPDLVEKFIQILKQFNH